jgi:phage baseplate assembly protein W
MPINIDFPFRFDPSGRTAGIGYEEHVRDMIEQVLFTTPGERVNRPDFGSGLLELVFEPNSDALAATLQMVAQASLVRWLGDIIDVEALHVTNDDSTLLVDLRYSIRRTGQGFDELFAYPPLGGTGAMGGAGT